MRLSRRRMKKDDVPRHPARRRGARSPWTRPGRSDSDSEATGADTTEPTETETAIGVLVVFVLTCVGMAMCAR